MQSALPSHNNMKKYPRNNGEDGSESFPDANSLILVTVNNTKQRVEVHVRGPFVPPHMVSTQIATIYELAEKYDTVLIYINSPGGGVDTLTELLGAFSRFKTVITVACGQVASAGFFLWCFGHIRVVQKYTVIMAHRESYRFDGKTQQHSEFATFTEEVCGSMIEDLCGKVLTVSEMDRIRLTEVFLSDKNMIERQFAIPWEQFIKRDELTLNVQTTAMIDDKIYIIEGDIATDEETGYGYDLNELMYDVPNKKILLNQEDTDGVILEIGVEE